MYATCNAWRCNLHDYIYTYLFTLACICMHFLIVYIYNNINGDNLQGMVLVHPPEECMLFVRVAVIASHVFYICVIHYIVVDVLLHTLNCYFYGKVYILIIT